VIDEAGVVAFAGGVDVEGIADPEEEREAPRVGVVVVAAVDLLLGEALAGVIDDARPAADPAQGERAAPVDGGGADLEERPASRRSLQGAAGAEPARAQTA
jgi:hypothetical protein